LYNKAIEKSECKFQVITVSHWGKKKKKKKKKTDNNEKG